ncbi:MAG: hypothetical protein PVF74_07950 [Anaerolineales bacterium]|jgi:hypothetical protein
MRYGNQRQAVAAFQETCDLVRGDGYDIDLAAAGGGSVERGLVGESGGEGCDPRLTIFTLNLSHRL